MDIEQSADAESSKQDKNVVYSYDEALGQVGKCQIVKFQRRTFVIDDSTK